MQLDAAAKNAGARMRGVSKPVSLARKIVIDFLHVATPLVVVKCTMKLERLTSVRARVDERPGWLTMIAKAYCIVARDEPWLRTYYLEWPWPHFYEVPKSIAMAGMIRDEFDREAPIVLKVGPADEMPLAELEKIIQRGKSAPLDEVPALRRMLRLARLPRPLRRLLLRLALNIGRQRPNYFGTFLITSVASLGVETVVLRTPGPAAMTYGMVRPDHTMELLFHWDHRVYDGIVAARAMRKLEAVLNGAIADELAASISA
jgi:hypothetical protein